MRYLYENSLVVLAKGTSYDRPIRALNGVDTFQLPVCDIRVPVGVVAVDSGLLGCNVLMLGELFDPNMKVL